MGTWCHSEHCALQARRRHSVLPTPLPQPARHSKGSWRGAPVRLCAQSQDPLLLRVARGEDGERTPVWLMRQAGRYMPEFRRYSDRYGFRHRSETAEIAIELSLQPWRAFRPDGVIMFSDILTILPALGVEFDVIPKRGPVIESPIRSMEQVLSLQPLEDPAKSLPFIQPILSALQREVGSASTVLGFVGSPWTLAAYAIEGKSDKHCMKTKTLMLHQPVVLHALLRHLTQAVTDYVSFQIQSGAQVVQIFDSWAHHLSPHQFEQFSLPYAEQIVQQISERHPDTPLIFHANGGTGKLRQMQAGSSAAVLGLDWGTSMAEARQTVGPNRCIQGNVDPMILFGPKEHIQSAVEECISSAGPRRHILNVGHGVAQGTPPDNVAWFCELARRSGGDSRACPAAAVEEHKQLLSV